MVSMGEDRDFECRAPAKGKLPLSTKRRVELTGLLDMATLTEHFLGIYTDSNSTTDFKVSNF